MQECEKYEDLISLYVDDEIDSEDLMLLLEHLDECVNCHEYYLDLKGIKENFKTIKIEYPVDLKNNILEHIEKNQTTQVVQIKQPKRLKAYLSLAACACLALIISSVTFFDNLNMGSDMTESASQPEAVSFAMTTEDTEMASPRMADIPVQESNEALGEKKLPAPLLSEYAFVFTLKGPLELPEGILGEIVYLDEETLVLMIENNISTAETIITALKEQGYYDFIIDTVDYKINTELENGIIAIFKD